MSNAIYQLGKCKLEGKDINTIVPSLPKSTEFVSDEILSEKIKTVKDLERYRWSISELFNPYYKKVEEAISKLPNVHDVSVHTACNELTVEYSINKIEVYHSVNINEYPDGLKTAISFSGKDYDGNSTTREPLCKEETYKKVFDIIDKEILFVIDHLVAVTYRFNEYEKRIRTIAKKYLDKEIEKREQLMKEYRETPCNLECDAEIEYYEEVIG